MRNHNLLSVIIATLGVWCFMSVRVVLAQTVDAAAVSAEESRLRAGTFRAGLKRRGLNVILEQHLLDFPPRDDVDKLLMTREIKLAEFADLANSQERRLVAIAEANALLRKLLNDKPYDDRRFDWQFTLGHSLIYQEAEPFFTTILYHGGGKADRQALIARSAAALQVLDSLLDQLDTENTRIDGLPIREFEKLEKTGYINRIDRLTPRATYLRLWSRFYDALPRPDSDSNRARNLRAILAELEANPAILQTDHHHSHVQVQAWLLAGMSHRLLNEHSKARSYLDRSLAIAGRLDDTDELARIQWAVTLAQIERVRNELEHGRFSDARENLSEFASWVEQQRLDRFPLHLVAALLDRDIARAELAARKYGGSKRLKPSPASFQPLVALIERYPDRRDEVFSTTTGLLDPGAGADQLDPFEQCALLITRLAEATSIDPPAGDLLASAIDAGRHFLDTPHVGMEALVPSVKYHLAAAQYHLGRLPEAAAGFLDVTRNHRTFEQSLPAATYAVQLASEMYADPSLHDHPEARKLYVDALMALMAQFPKSEAARYWRFYLAQTLEELNRFDQAAEHYGLVHDSHEHYVDSLFLRVRSLARGLEQVAQSPPSDPIAFQARLDAFLKTQRQFITRISALSTQPQTFVETPWSRYLARAKLLAAEVEVLAAVDRPGRALDDLVDFESAYPGETSLAGRLWRTRLIAYEKLERLDEAAAAIPRYTEADPENAMPVLQHLLDGLRTDAQELFDKGEDTAAQKKADIALLVAEQIMKWSNRPSADLDASRRRAIETQWAQANLLAERFTRARDLFKTLLDADLSLARDSAPIVRWGYAESLYRLGDYPTALPVFNELAIELPASGQLRWKSLLRDLECRTALKHDPKPIIQVVDQQRFLYPQLGGPAIAPKLQKLKRQNQRRADES